MKCVCGFDDPEGYQFMPIFFDTPNDNVNGAPKVEMNQLKTFYMHKGHKVYSTVHACPKCGTLKIDL